MAACIAAHMEPDGHLRFLRLELKGSLSKWSIKA